MDRSPRLAELVVHLTDCSPDAAVAAVSAAMASAPVDTTDPLEIVARAMRALRPVDLTSSVDLRDPAKVRVP